MTDFTATTAALRIYQDEAHNLRRENTALKELLRHLREARSIDEVDALIEAFDSPNPLTAR